MQNKKILIFSEAVTLAHVTRPIEIARNLKAVGYDVYFAASQVPSSLKNRLGSIETFELRPIVTQEMFLQAISKGAHPYTEEIIGEYVDEEVKLIENLKPDLVIGDMRLSLHISCHITGVKYVNLSNSHWDSNAQLPTVVPDLPIRRIFGEKITRLFFPIIRPIILKSLARPFNRVASKFGVPKYGNYLEVLCSGDFTFYYDAENLVKRTKENPQRVDMGPLTYGMTMPLPESVRFEADKKQIFLSLGSSGPTHLLPKMISALSKLDVDVHVATAGKQLRLPDAANIHLHDYLPFDEMIKNSDLLICSGGSANVYPALAQGKPVLVVPANIDQLLFSQAIVQHGVGLEIRADSFSENLFSMQVLNLIDNPCFQENAMRFKSEFFKTNPVEKTNKMIHDILSR